MVTKERMDIFIDEHINPNIKYEVRLKTSNLIDSKNDNFMSEIDAILTIEDVVGDSAGLLLLEILRKY